MSNYTVELGQLKENGVEIFPSDFPFYVDDEEIRKEFISKFEDRYYFNEIGFETPQRFIHMLNARLRLKKPYYEAMYKTILKAEELDFMTNKDFVETIKRTYDKDIVMTDDRTGTRTLVDSGTVEDNGTTSKNDKIDKTNVKDITKNGTKSMNNNSNSKESNIDDGISSASLEDGLLTNVGSVNATESSSGFEKGVEDTTSNETLVGSGTSTNTKTLNTTNTQNDDLHRNQSHKDNTNENIEKTSKGTILVNKAELLEKWRKIIYNIDEVIIDDCRDLFMVIY